MAQSGGIFEAKRFAKICEVSRTTISNYLKVLESTFVVHIVRPFTTHRATEIVSAPKVYGFDSGFVCYHRGIINLRPEDYGFLWKHFVLNELHSQLQIRNIFYWRDKRGHEVDFVIKERGGVPIIIECKWKLKTEDIIGKDIKAFLRQYPDSQVYIVSSDTKRTYYRKYDATSITIISLPSLIKVLIDQSS